MRTLIAQIYMCTSWSLRRADEDRWDQIIHLPICWSYIMRVLCIVVVVVVISAHVDIGRTHFENTDMSHCFSAIMQQRFWG